MKHLIFFLFAAACFGQAATLTVSGPASAKVGSTVTLTVSATGVTSTGAAAILWGVTPPTGFVISAATAGSVATAAGKTLTCGPGNAYCVVAGLNQTVIGIGTLATYTITIPATAAGGSTPFPLIGLSAATPGALALVLTPGPTYALTVVAKADLNGDGKVDGADMTLMLNEVLASRTNPSACVDDQNGDGQCDAVDLMIVVLRALGL